MLRGRPLHAELRYRDPSGEMHTEKAVPSSLEERESGHPGVAKPTTAPIVAKEHEPAHVFPYGIARNRLQQAAKRMQVPIHQVKDLGQANVLITTKSFYRKRPRLIVDAERRGLPIYVLRANTVSQMEACLSDIFDLESRSTDPLHQALREAEEAIQQVQGGSSEVELSPQNAYIRRKQHELARTANLTSYSVDKGTNRRVRICRED